MVDSVNNVARLNLASTPSILGNIEKKISSITTPVHQTDLVKQIEKARQSTVKKIQDQKQETDEQVKTFVQKSSLYTTVSLLHSHCNNGEKTEEDDRTYRLIVKELSKKKNPGFWGIRRIMKKYFSELSSIKMFFSYFFFLGWLPKLYIKSSLEKILDFSRNRLKKGNNLPILGSDLLDTMNSYLANYNRTVERFRDDPNNPIGDRDVFIKKELHKKELLGYPSIEQLHKNFARAASREETRPAFRALSSPIKKLQLLKFDFLEKHANFLRKPLLFFTYLLGFIPYYSARAIEAIPNRIIKSFHRSIINFFMPTVIQNTLEAISKPGFTHAINSFLCDIIQDLLIEMAKKPEDKKINDIPNVVNETLSQDIRKFSELVYTLLKREPYKTQEELHYLFTSKGYIDRSWITPIFVDALHTNIIDGFNVLFAKPEKLEEYLCDLIKLLNKVFDYVPDPNTDEGKALLEEMKEKQKRREKLVDELIEKGINLAADDKLNTRLNMLSRHQRENLLVSYRKIQKKATDRLPDIDQDAKDILNSSGYVLPSSAQARQAKEDIERTMRDIERLFIAISNVMTSENGLVRKKMTKHLQPFLQKEQLLKDSIIQINNLHDQKEGLKLIKSEIKHIKHLLKTNSQNQATLISIEKHLQRLNEINKKHQFNPIIAEYQILGDHLKKIQSHKIFADKLQEILNTTFFTNNLIFNLAHAQKEYLMDPNSDKKEHILVKVKNQMQTFLKQLEGLGFSQDTQEIQSGMKKLLETQHPEQLNEVYKDVLSLVRKKTAKHRSLYVDEQTVLPNYFDKCKVIIEKHIATFPKMLEKIHLKLINYAELLTMTVEQMQKSLKDIGKQNFADNLDAVNISKILSAIAGFSAGYLGFIGKTLSIGIGSAALGSSIFTPLDGVRKLANSVIVPLAKTTANSAYSITTNQTFYEGLIHAYMRQFIAYVKKTKGSL